MNLETTILKELERQVIAPERVIKLRLCLYPQGFTEDYLWSKVHYAIRALKNTEKIRPYKKWLAASATFDGHWQEELDTLYRRKQSVYNAWNKAATAGGYHLKNLVQQYLTDHGIDVDNRTVTWKQNRFRIDAMTEAFVIKMKNTLSDMFYNPNSITSPNSAHKQIKWLFEYCTDASLQPILIAPLIDDSFYTFARQHNGLFCRTFQQILKSEHILIQHEVAQTFSISNLQATSRIPSILQQWLDRHIL